MGEVYVNTLSLRHSVTGADGDAVIEPLARARLAWPIETAAHAVVTPVIRLAR